MDLKFPKGFLFGSSTSSHQVEGYGNNDWTEWEQKNAKRLALEAQTEMWPDFVLHSFPSPRDPENYISGIACDHYHRFREDFDIVKDLGHNAHRFSIEWSRIEPEEGKFDEKEIEHYAQVIHALRERGMEPFVTLWHWTLPLWLRDLGGVESKQFPEYFARFYKKIVSSFKDDVTFYVTLNEPDVFTLNGYLRGIWPPQKKSIFVYYHISANLIRAHRKAYNEIKRIQPSAQIGVVVSLTFFESAGGLINNIATWFLRYMRNHYFLNHIRSTQDFIGVNYYFHCYFDYGIVRKGFDRISDLGWQLFSRGMYYVLREAKKFNKPIYITENGLADAQDKQRAWFVDEILKEVRCAMDEGVDVRGYFHWSLLDNFEWDKGFWPRFGLVEIDYQLKAGLPQAEKTLERKIRSSAWEYKKIIESSQL